MYDQGFQFKGWINKDSDGKFRVFVTVESNDPKNEPFSLHCPETFEKETDAEACLIAFKRKADQALIRDGFPIEEMGIS